MYCHHVRCYRIVRDSGWGACTATFMQTKVCRGRNASSSFFCEMTTNSSVAFKMGRSWCVTGGDSIFGRCGGPKPDSDGRLIRVRPLRRQHREDDQRRADGLGSVAGADTFAVWIGCCAVIGCRRGLHESPHHEFWQCGGRRVCDRGHTAKALCTRCFDPLAAGERRVWVCDAKAMVSTGQLASVMMR